MCFSSQKPTANPAGYSLEDGGKQVKVTKADTKTGAEEILQDPAATTTTRRASIRPTDDAIRM